MTCLNTDPTVPQFELNLALITALGIGLMIGIVRERTHTSDNAVAGVRTHTLVAAAGFVAMGFGDAVYTAALLALGLLTVASYRVTSASDPGLTGEVALLVNALLAGLAHTDPATAASLGVVVALLLYAKPSIQHISRNWLAEGELNDALLVAAAALVVLPMLPAQPLDPWGVVRLDVLWRVVVLIMAMAVLGHWAQRLLGDRWGLPVAGFFSGWVSSTAAVATMGNEARKAPSLGKSAAASALLANLASVLLLLGVLGAASPALLREIALPLGLGCIALLAYSAVLLRTQTGELPNHGMGDGRAVNLKRAAILACVILSVSLLGAVLDHYFGHAGVLLGSLVVALAEVHSAAIGIAQLVAGGKLGTDSARWFVLAILGASVVAKSVLAFVSGGKSYGLRVATGLLLLLMLGGAGLLI